MFKRLMLIDDDRDDALIFSEALASVNANITLAHFFDGAQAIKAMETSRQNIPDLIFLDVNMPSIDGWECLRKIKERAFISKIPIIMYSTSDLERQALSPSDTGATAFLTKPQKIDELKTNLSQLFQKLGTRELI